MTPPAVLRTRLGDATLLARPGQFRLFVLNESAAWIWDGLAAGLEPEDLARMLAERFELPEPEVVRQVETSIAQWRRACLFEPAPAPPALALAAPPIGPAIDAPAWTLRLGELSVALHLEDAGLRERLAGIVEHLRHPAETPADRRLALRGSAAEWALAGDGLLPVSGTGLDAALTETIGALIDIGCDAEARLAVLHGAGLVSAEGYGIALIGPGGSGKTTLAMALNAGGYALLGDDTVPVSNEGLLIGLRMSACVKAGSWAALSRWRPDIETAETLQRFGEPVRYLPPTGPAAQKPVPLRRFLFPRYSPEAAPGMTPLSPVEALQRIVEAEAVIRNLSQTKLDALVRWVESAPAFELVYPDLDSALRLVRRAAAMPS